MYRALYQQVQDCPYPTNILTNKETSYRKSTHTFLAEDTAVPVPLTPKIKNKTIYLI